MFSVATAGGVRTKDQISLFISALHISSELLTEANRLRRQAASSGEESARRQAGDPHIIQWGNCSQPTPDTPDTSHPSCPELIQPTCSGTKTPSQPVYIKKRECKICPFLTNTSYLPCPTVGFLIFFSIAIANLNPASFPSRSPLRRSHSTFHDRFVTE